MLCSGSPELGHSQATARLRAFTRKPQCIQEATLCVCSFCLAAPGALAPSPPGGGSSGSKAGLAIGTAPSSFHPARSMAITAALGSQSVSSGSDAPRKQELVAKGCELLCPPHGSCLSMLRGGGGQVSGGKHHFSPSLPSCFPFSFIEA